MAEHYPGYFRTTPAKDYSFIGYYTYRRHQDDFSFSHQKEASKLSKKLEELAKDDSEEIREAVADLQRKFKVKVARAIAQGAVKAVTTVMEDANNKLKKRERPPLRDLTNVGAVAPDSVIATQPPSITEIRGWSTERLIHHLQVKFPDDLVDEDFEILQKRRIRGRAFLMLTKEDLMTIGMEFGPTAVLAGYIEELKDERPPKKARTTSLRGLLEDPGLELPVELEKKRRAKELPTIKKRKWTVSGTITLDEASLVYYVDPAEHVENQRFVASIKSRQLLMIMGARASGKSTRLHRLMNQLAEDGYLCYVVSFERVNVKKSEDIFWTTIGSALQGSHDQLKDIQSADEFLKLFHQNAWKEQKIVIFFDEFDKLYNATNEIRDQCLETFREIRNNRHLYAIHSIVACGTFSIRHLNSTDSRSSPFNVAESLRNPYFGMQQTHCLFDEYAQDEEITIDHDIVDDIYSKTNGHPGMVCLCGRAIAENLLEEVDYKTKNLNYEAWQTFSVDGLHRKIYDSYTFRKMVDSLLSEKATAAVDLLRSHFIGFLDDVFIGSDERKKQADFLTAEGVLLKHEIDGNYYHMASALIDSLIRQHVIPQKYPSSPLIPIPKLHGKFLDTLGILKEALSFFDKDLMRLAPDRSYKKSKVYVDGFRDVPVPRESVYDTEFMRILTNWLSQTCYMVTGQWHLKNNDGKNRYSDIVIKELDDPTIVLELMATGDSNCIKTHVDRTFEYKKLLSAREAWVIHFTREDEYLEHPYWQSDDKLNEGINMVHFWHDMNFKTVRMSARWKDVDGNVQQVDDQLLAV